MTGQDAAKWLRQAQTALADRQDVLRVAKQLRKVLPADKAAWVLEQVQLRVRARKKFDLADRMYFTRVALEQATSQLIAEYKSARFIGAERGADICCGIGGDLLSLAQCGRRKTMGLDADPVVAAFATANARVHGVEAEVVCERFENREWRGWDAVHIDPDRRRAGRRTAADRLHPPLSEILEKVAAETGLAIKLAPATPYHAGLPPSAQREWIGHRRECKQQMIWMNGLESHSATRTATVVFSDSVASYHVPESEIRQTPRVAECLGDFLFEPHAALLASGLVDSFCESYGLARVAEGIGYLTADADCDHPLLSRFRVMESHPLSSRRVTYRLDQLDCGRVEVKHRGIIESAARAYRKYRPRGSRPLTLILTPTRNRGTAVICERIPSAKRHGT